MEAIPPPSFIASRNIRFGALATVCPLLASLAIRRLRCPSRRLAASVHGSVSLGVCDRLNVIYVESGRRPDAPPAGVNRAGSLLYRPVSSGVVRPGAILCAKRRRAPRSPPTATRETSCTTAPPPSADPRRSAQPFCQSPCATAGSPGGRRHLTGARPLRLNKPNIRAAAPHLADSSSSAAMSPARPATIRPRRRPTDSQTR